jgi:hypothetical protein
VGLNYTAENYPKANVLIMDSDGEDRPDFIPILLNCLNNEAVDVVIAPRTTRKTNLKFKILYRLYKTFFRVLTGKNLNFGNFSALKPRAVKILVSQPDLWMHIGATFLNSNLRLNYCPLPRGERYFGISKSNSNSLIQHGIRSVVVFADRVIVRVFVLITCIFGISLISDLYALFHSEFKISIGIYLWCLSTGIMLILFLGAPKYSNIDVVRSYKWTIESAQEY